MKKTILLSLCTAGLLLLGCTCAHEWHSATCSAPKTCAKCGITEGDPLEHVWVEATCTKAKHCSLCGLSAGDIASHTWVEASCTAPKHCSLCGLSEGEKTDHEWLTATYEKPATCAVCGETTGEPMPKRFPPPADHPLLGTWKTEILLPTEELWLMKSSEGLLCNYYLTFRDDAIYQGWLEIIDVDRYRTMKKESESILAHTTAMVEAMLPSDENAGPIPTPSLADFIPSDAEIDRMMAEDENRLARQGFFEIRDEAEGSLLILEHAQDITCVNEYFTIDGDTLTFDMDYILSYQWQFPSVDGNGAMKTTFITLPEKDEFFTRVSAD